MALRADDVDLGRDRDLVERHQSGDPQAFDDLYRRYFARLHRFCQRHTSDRHEAEEIAQEAFVKAFRSMHTLRGERRFYPWVTVIAKRISIDRHRKLSRVELTDEPDLGSVDPDVEHLFDAVDLQHLREAMSRLGPRHREVLVLREAHGMSYAEIAQHLDVPVTTVEALLHRARKALRREYTAAGGEPRGLWGVPLFAWLATRGGRLRSALSERWAEAAAVAAPVAAGAVTAAIVLVPSPAVPVEHATGPAGVGVVPAVSQEPAAPPPGDPVDVAAPTAPGAPSPTAPSSPPPPSAQAGPVDLYTDPEGADHAREEAEDMPLNASTDPVTAGADPTAALDQTDDFTEDAAGAAARAAALVSTLGGS